MRVMEIPSDERPRERLIRYGTSGLSNTELLAIILGHGTKDNDAISLAQHILTTIPISKMVNATIGELKKINGIGIVKSIQIKAMFALVKRSQINTNKKTKIRCARDVYNFMKTRTEHLEKEHFFVLHMNTKNVIIELETISIGTLNATIIHPREVFRRAIRNNVNCIIIAHNHPSGESSPSREDGEITKRLNEAGKILDIKVIDHIVIGKDTYYSFAEEEKIE